MSELFSQKEKKKKILKEMIKKLHLGAKPDDLKAQFGEVLKGVNSTDIAEIEEELIKEGMQREEIQRLCEIHLALFKESLEKEKPLAPSGHPINTLMEEHKILLDFTDKLKNIANKIKKSEDFTRIEAETEHLSHISDHFKESESHYVREENVLFPYLEKHGITQPPAIMWAEHNEIREIKKKLYRILDERESMDYQVFIKELESIAISLSNMLQSHFYKENNILFPTALKVITEKEWEEIKEQFDELGYCCFTPGYAKEPIEETIMKVHETGEEGRIVLESGSFSKEELETILDTLPVDITFVDKEDTVRYFSQSKERIFTRTKAIIGRKVQLCHPQQSLDRVEEILKDFKNNKRDSADFWLNYRGRLVYIRYFALRRNGEYLGCLEVTQDITNIKKIEGEKRLLEDKIN